MNKRTNKPRSPSRALLPKTGGRGFFIYATIKLEVLKMLNAITVTTIIPAMQPPAPAKRRSYVSECNFNYCMHYSEKRRRCALRRCHYDRPYGGYQQIEQQDAEDEMLCHG